VWCILQLEIGRGREKSHTVTLTSNEAAQKIAEHRFLVNASNAVRCILLVPVSKTKALHCTPSYCTALSPCVIINNRSDTMEGRQRGGEGVRLDDYLHPQDLYLCIRLSIFVMTSKPTIEEERDR
jgi:hypothetical protein